MSWQDIPGRSAYLWIYDEFVASAPRGAVVVEVGVALGKSISYLARKCIDAGRDDIRIYAVDAWAGTARNGEQQASGPPSAEGDWELFQRMMQTHAPEELTRIAVLREFSAQAAHTFAVRSVDLVVLDAAHDYVSVLADLSAWVPVLRLGGAIGGDDWEPEYPGVEAAVRRFFGPSSSIEVRHECGWGTWRVKF